MDEWGGGAQVERGKFPLRAAGNGDRAFRVDVSVRHRDRTFVIGERGGWVIHGLRLTVDKPAAH